MVGTFIANMFSSIHFHLFNMEKQKMEQEHENRNNSTYVAIFHYYWNNKL